MIDFVYNDGGRRDAGYKGDTGDCVVRAIAIVAAEDYQSVYKEMADTMKGHGYVASGNAHIQKPKAGQGTKNKAGAIQEKVLRAYGFEKVKLPKGPRPTYTEAFEQYGNCIVSTTRHMAALVGGALHDIFDGRQYQMLTPYCLDCHRSLFPELEADGSGGGYKCYECGKESDPVVIFNEDKERKAMSVWVLA